MLQGFEHHPCQISLQKKERALNTCSCHPLG